MIEKTKGDIHIIERVLRMFIGFSLIASVVYIQTPFNYLIVMPLLGIYPCWTAVVGWDPIYYLANINHAHTFFNFDVGLNHDSGFIQGRASGFA